MTPIDKMMSMVEWVPTGQNSSESDGMPYATHSGVLDLFGTPMKCFRLNTGEAVFDADDFAQLFENMGIEK